MENSIRDKGSIAISLGHMAYLIAENVCLAIQIRNEICLHVIAVAALCSCCKAFLVQLVIFIKPTAHHPKPLLGYCATEAQS